MNERLRSTFQNHHTSGKEASTKGRFLAKAEEQKTSSLTAPTTWARASHRMNTRSIQTPATAEPSRQLPGRIQLEQARTTTASTTSSEGELDGEPAP
jgi:hypothetical protein